MDKITYFTHGDKTICDGCAACQQACPFEALEMMPDENGFIFPYKDLNKCTNCGICERVCPFPTPNYNNYNDPIILASYLKDKEERCKSTSGGLFYAIAKYIIEESGIVYGAIMNENFQVHHKGVEKIKDLQSLRGSKYVQSSTNNCFREVKKNLKEGRLVYYSGTGCQIAGLKAFLKKDYQNLFTSDLICHGVPPEKLFIEHINFLKNKGYNLNYYSFRNFKNSAKEEILSCNDSNYEIHRNPLKSPYYYAFSKSYIFRLSCYKCPFAHVPRQGDLTLGDFWGIKEYNSKIENENGISLVSLNSEKGKKLWEKIKNSTIYFELSNVNFKKFNPNFIRPTVKPEIREIIFTLIQEKGYEYVAKKYFSPSKNEFFKNISKNMLKRIIGQKNIDFIKKLVK